MTNKEYAAFLLRTHFTFATDLPNPWPTLHEGWSFKQITTLEG